MTVDATSEEIAYLRRLREDFFALLSRPVNSTLGEAMAAVPSLREAANGYLDHVHAAECAERVVASEAYVEPTPEGWDDPSDTMAGVRAQYIEAAQRANEAMGVLDIAVEHWRDLVLKPTITEALFVLQHSILSLLLSGDRQLPLGVERLLRRYEDVSVAESVAISEYLHWAGRQLTESTDEWAMTMRSNIHAMGLDHLLR